MKELIRDLHSRSHDPIAQAAKIHAQFEQIHPFSDGNGRVGRLLLHAMFLRANYPPAVIRQERKRFYLHALNRAQLHGDFGELENVLYDAVLEGYRVLERR
jgi:Fic family protein